MRLAQIRGLAPLAEAEAKAGQFNAARRSALSLTDEILPILSHWRFACAQVAQLAKLPFRVRRAPAGIKMYPATQVHGG